jgi:hypothetical protein
VGRSEAEKVTGPNIFVKKFGDFFRTPLAKKRPKTQGKNREEILQLTS